MFQQPEIDSVLNLAAVAVCGTVGDEQIDQPNGWG